MKIEIKVIEGEKTSKKRFSFGRRHAIVEIRGDKEIVEDVKLLIEDASKNDYDWDIS